MKEQVKWFGRYLGCSSVSIYSDNTIRPKSKLKIISCTWFSISNRKLILKELNDISHDDIEELNDHLFGDVKTRITEITKEQLQSRFFPLLYAAADFLRSKGYAIGIPKEFYITESELKEESK